MGINYSKYQHSGSSTNSRIFRVPVEMRNTSGWVDILRVFHRFASLAHTLVHNTQYRSSAPMENDRVFVMMWNEQEQHTQIHTHTYVCNMQTHTHIGNQFTKCLRVRVQCRNMFVFTCWSASVHECVSLLMGVSGRVWMYCVCVWVCVEKCSYF